MESGELLPIASRIPGQSHAIRESIVCGFRTQLRDLRQFVCRFERKKGIDLAVKALAGLKSRVPAELYNRVKLVLAGGYDERVQVCMKTVSIIVLSVCSQTIFCSMQSVNVLSVCASQMCCQYVISQCAVSM